MSGPEPTSSTRPEEFFSAVQLTFETAASAVPLETDYFSIGGAVVRFVFAGPALRAGLTAALEHLRVEPTSDISLSVGLMDSVSTGVYLPPPPWSPEDYLPRCGVRGFSNDTVQVAFEPTAGILSVLHQKQNQAYFWIRDARNLPEYQKGSPLLHVVHPWLAGQGRSLLHAGAVGTPEGGVILVGKGGSGKSTAALCCLNSSLLYGADDYGVLSLNPTPLFISLYSSGKIHAADVHKHPHIQSAQRDGTLENGKALYFFQSHFPEKISTGFPLRGIVLPRVSHNVASRIYPTTPQQALLALAPSTLFQLPGGEAASFQRLSRLVKSVPSFILESGSDWNQIPAVLTDLIHRLNA